MLDRLVGGAVLAQADGIVCQHVDHAQPHQRGHADGVARVVREGHEGAAVGDQPAVQRHAVHHRRHAELAHAVADVVAVPFVVDPDRSLHIGQVGTGEVGRAAQQLRQGRRQRFQAELRGLARGDLALQCRGRIQQRHQCRIEAFRQPAIDTAQEFPGQFGMRGAIGGEARFPFSLPRRALDACVPGIGHVRRHGERLGLPAQRLAHGRDLRRAQRCAMDIVATGLGRGALADHGAAADQRGPVALGLGRVQRRVDGVRIMPVDAGDHVPAVRGKALRGVIGKPAGDVAVDGDAVVVVQADQLAQPERARQRAGLVAETLHQAAIAKEDIGVMVDDVEAGPVEGGGQQLLRQRHADGIGQALPQRPGGGLHARCHVDFRMPRRGRVQLAELAQLRHRQVVAGQVQQRVLQHGSMAVGQHEAVAVGPGRVGGVVAQVAPPQRLGHLGHAHGRAGVA
ncbi:hypothetical protein D3C81_1093330 [compost metagenome]